jgi:hypothetical protein
VDAQVTTLGHGRVAAAVAGSRGGVVPVLEVLLVIPHVSGARILARFAGCYGGCNRTATGISAFRAIVLNVRAMQHVVHPRGIADDFVFPVRNRGTTINY